MDLYSIHPHALKHGLSKDEITSAWNQAFAWFRRDLDNGALTTFWLEWDATVG